MERAFTWKLILEYEGTRYRGWQEQANARTVAGELRRAAESALDGRVEILGSGRTDAGVHAIAQVARLVSTRSISPVALMQALNGRLPQDIQVLSLERARPGFNPRADAIARYYLFQISTRRSAFAKRWVWWIKDPLDLGRLHAAAAVLPGHHDFRIFCEDPASAKSTHVRVTQAEIGCDGDLILFRIGASHFLWKMVRRIVGLLVEVGRGMITPESFGEFVTRPEVESQSKAGLAAERTAPPSGLFLERVIYSRRDEPGPLRPVVPVRSVLTAIRRSGSEGAS